MAVTGGGAQQNIPIPGSLAASGTIAFQWVTVDLAKNGLGTSDAGHAEVGL